MRIAKKKVFNLMDTNGRRGDVTNALQGYLQILDTIQKEKKMNWVVKKANILNVACTRAKYRIAFIGNINDWKNRRYFREFIPNLIDIINV